MMIMTTMMMLFWDLHTAADDDGGGGDEMMTAATVIMMTIMATIMMLFGTYTLVAPDRPSTAKTLTDDCSALYWTQELGLTCLESGRRARRTSHHASHGVEAGPNGR